MKSKKFIISLISFSLLLANLLLINGASSTPQIQANGSYSLGFEIGDYFEFYCTEFDTTGLNTVFGGDWATNLGSLFWWTGYNAPSALGEKTRFSIVNITLPSTTWSFILDGWDWIAKTSTFGIPTQDDVPYNLPQNASTAIFNPSAWLLALQVEDYITDMSLLGGYSSSGNEIYYNSSDITDYQLGWIFDTDTAVVKQFWIKDDTSTIIFEMWGFELKVQEVETYNWIVTELNAVELENVFGSDWNLDLNAYCWWALDSPTTIGNKSKLEVDLIATHPTYDDWYRFEIDGWSWIGEDVLFDALPDRDNVGYSLPMDPEGVAFHYSLFLIATPVIRYLETISYPAGYSASGNTVTRSHSDVANYEAVWVYDEELGVTELFQIKNSVGNVIFEVWLMEFKIPVGTEFTWEVTTLNEVGLEGVFGPDWEANLQSWFGTDCNQAGAKLKREITEINLFGNLWSVSFNQWDWTTSAFGSNPDLTDTYGLFCNPQDGFWGSWMWLVTFPPHYYLVGRSYSAGVELSGLVVTLNVTDVQDFQVKFTYDAILGVFNTAQVFDNTTTLVFEYRLISAVTGGGIPGYDLFISLSTIILLIGFISIVSIKKVKRK
ncbi:MAG: hypothetical protein ACFE9N_04620 [Promethearchaeota archaeon]